jgi:hypothetical protein
MLRYAAARAAVDQTGRSQPDGFVMYSAAARLARGCEPSDALPPGVRAAVEPLATWEATGRGRLRDWRPATGVPTSERPEALTELFGALDASTKPTAPPRGRLLTPRRRVLAGGASGLWAG